MPAVPLPDEQVVDPTRDHVVALGISDKTILYGIRVLCLVGIAISNLYAWSMTTTGFIHTRLLPSNEVFGAVLVPIVVAAFVQLGILAFYLSVPYFQSRQRWLNAGASTLAISLIAISAVFALYSITMTSPASNITSFRAAEIVGVNNRLVRLDAEISGVYGRFISGLNESRIAACNGRDETGIARCGPISNQFLERQSRARNRFGPQLEQGAFGVVAPSGDLMTNWNLLNSHVQFMEAKLGAFSTFADENQMSPTATAMRANFEAIKAETGAIGRNFRGQSPDQKSIVLDQVFRDLGDIFTLRASASTYFAALIAILPDLLSLTFTALLIIARSAGLATLKRAASVADENATNYQRLSEAWKRMWEARSRWNNVRRHAAVAEAVDSSVPDVAKET